MAAEAFESAEQSLTRLGRNDLFARGVHQSLRESVAARDLIPEPLSILLSTARQALADGRFDDWKKNFESIDRDGWIVVDARISSAYRSDEPDVIRVDYPMVIAGNRVELEFNAATSLLVSLGDESRRMILAAQIEDCQPPSPARETWMVRLRGETVFPWSGAQSLLALGFETDEETRALLARQADDLGLNE
jgi:hypothetical protein